MTEVSCGNCGKTLYRPPSRVKKARNQFCDTACHDAFRTNKLETSCQNCGKVFEYVPSTNRRYCSHSCHQEWYWKNDPRAKKQAEAAAKRNRSSSPMPDQETLRRLHHDEEMTPKQIGEIFGVQGQTARNWIYRSGIEFNNRHPRLSPPIKKPIPSKKILRSLYIDQGFTSSAIGERFGVAGVTVAKWLKAYDINIRPGGVGLESRGIQAPSGDELFQMIHDEHLSYAQVAEKYGVDQSAVPYWLDKLCIPRSKSWHERHSDPETLKEMEELYNRGMSLVEIGSMYGGVSKPTIASLFRANGIEIRKDGFENGRRYTCLDGHEVRSSYEMKVDNWLYKHGIEHIYEPRIPGDSHIADFLANGWYIEVWGVMNNAKYHKTKQIKQAHYRYYELPLIEISHYMFASARNNLWSRCLSRCLNPPT